MQSRNAMPEGGGALAAHRPVVNGRRGMVASAHYEASMSGLRMFIQGGNAVDAVVAAASTLNVVEPFMSGLGGIGFLVISRNHGKDRQVLNFSGVVPSGGIPEAFTPENHSVGVRCPLVPGNPAGWLTMLEAYGTLSRSKVLAPAIELAEKGFVISRSDERYYEVNRERLAQFPTSKAVYMPHGDGPKPGDIFKQPDRDALFQQHPELAEKIVKLHLSRGKRLVMWNTSKVPEVPQEWFQKWAGDKLLMCGTLRPEPSKRMYDSLSHVHRVYIAKLRKLYGQDPLQGCHVNELWHRYACIAGCRSFIWIQQGYQNNQFLHLK